ncbi:MAG: aminotransferase class V-fold PLP-dependent enzyme, partial [Actinomycetota bacterium]|nr:aminotransferase class V-fold PLP-dependent enzyme [Actinomycetota bacterium]
PNPNRPIAPQRRGAIGAFGSGCDRSFYSAAVSGPAQVHPSAEIEPGAAVGDGTRVWRHAHIRAGAVVGDDCTIAARVFVDAGVRIGNGVKIQDNVSVFAGVEIDDDVLIGPSAVFTNDRHPRATGDWEISHTRVGRGASIGANATLVCGIAVGEGALVAAGAVVTRDVEPYELVAGNPARRLGWVCECGRTLAHTEGPHPSVWECRHCGRSSPSGTGGISLHAVDLGPTAERLVREVIRSGQVAAGPMVERFEREWATEIGVDHAVSVTSGTSALLLALRACGVGPGDEVVTTPLTFAATLSAVVEVGAVVRFADVDEHGTMAPESLEAIISERTRAVVPVHLYGLPADMPAITALAVSHGTHVIEDAAQAAGATVAGRKAGSFGVGCFSFYATKNLTTGEGGMVTTDDPAQAERLRMLRNHGRGPGGDHVVVGQNYRMTDLQAALGVAQRRELRERNERRRQNAALLNEGLAGIRGLLLPIEPPGRTSSYSLYTIRVTEGAALSRDGLADALQSVGIESAVYYRRLVYEEPAFRDNPGVTADRVPMATALTTQVLSLPVHPGLSSGDIRRIVASVREALR